MRPKFVPEAEVKPKVVIVPAEAVRLVEETLVEETVTIPSLPRAVIVPVEETANWVEEFTCRFMKSPLKPVEGLAPRNVPEAEPPTRAFGPR